MTLKLGIIYFSMQLDKFIKIYFLVIFEVYIVSL